MLGLLGLTGFSALTAAETGTTLSIDYLGDNYTGTNSVFVADDYKVTALPGLPDTELTSISQYAG